MFSFFIKRKPVEKPADIALTSFEEYEGVLVDPADLLEDDPQANPITKQITSSSIDELSSSDLNKLIEDQMENEKKYLAETGSLKFKKNNKGYARPLKYFIIEKEYSSESKEEAKSNKKRIVFFNVTKDAETEENQPHLYNICQLLNQKREKEPEKTELLLQREKTLGSIFVIPLQQCRGLFSLPPEYASKAHIVLAIYNNSTNELKVYDSQGCLRISIPVIGTEFFLPMPHFFYPDKLAEKFQKEYKGVISLKTQRFPHLCGYFVNTFIASFLKEGHADRFEKIHLTPELIISKENYILAHSKLTHQILESTEDSWVELPSVVTSTDSSEEIKNNRSGYAK